jgi:predicted acylesterase/phospholipase RssA
MAEAADLAAAASDAVDPVGGPLPETLTTYEKEDFTGRPLKDCDLVMKGGVTSGVVYPYTILELARTFRLRSVGGTSAGAIAAAFAAAAEYARHVRNDPGGFVRLQTHCNDLPARLKGLFQPSPQFAGLMRFLLRCQAARSASLAIPILIWTFWLTSLVGFLAPALTFWRFAGGWAGFGWGIVGLALTLVTRLGLLIVRGLPANGFGMCHGCSPPGSANAALMEWVHSALQDIAFGNPAHTEPLTFGHLVGKDPEHPIINLRMITTNMSAGRPHTLPGLPFKAGFLISEWSKRLPGPVITYLQEVCKPWPDLDGALTLPPPSKFPVIAAVRMSLSFPVLFSAVPLIKPGDGRDEGAPLDAKPVVDPVTAATHALAPLKPMTLWFTDGGISSNFPIHMFDAPLPAWPTFALSLDELGKGMLAQRTRVWLPKDAAGGLYLPVKRIESLADFGNGVLNSAKDWQDQLLSAMPGQRERIAHVVLENTEGGLNLAMGREVSQRLMLYGRQAGVLFGRDFDFSEHRWRRSLVFYDQLSQGVAATNHEWSSGYGAWFKGYSKPRSYKAVTARDRRTIYSRIGAFAALASGFAPQLPNQAKKFPKPPGILRITPKF